MGILIILEFWNFKDRAFFLWLWQFPTICYALAGTIKATSKNNWV